MRLRSALSISFAVGVAAALTGCGEGAPGAADPSAPAAFGPQPAIAPAGVEGTLGTSLGAAGETSPGAETAMPGPLRQVVAGARHLYALDDSGAAFCIADSPLDTGPFFPTRWTRVENAPPLAILFAAGDTTCGAPLSGGLHCWGQAVLGAPEVVSWTRARELVRGELQVLAVLSAEGPWSSRRICVQTSPTRISCDLAGEVAHIDFPSAVADPVVTGSRAYGRIGDVVYDADVTAGSTANATPNPAFPRVASLAGVTAGLVCGVAASGDGHCISNDDAAPSGTLPPGEAMFSVAPGSTLAGGCVRTPGGAVACGLPVDDAPACDLGLLRIQAVGSRACGPTAEGAWRCLGRIAPATLRHLPGLEDHAGCPG